MSVKKSAVYCVDRNTNIHKRAWDVLLQSREYKYTRQQWRSHIHTALLITVMLQRIDGEAIINSSESWASTQLGNPLLLFVVLLLTNGSLAENEMHMDEVSHDIYCVLR